MSDQLAFWAKQLNGLREEVPLPADRPRPVKVSGEGAWIDLPLPGRVLKGLRALAADAGGTLSTGLRAAVACADGRDTGFDKPRAEGSSDMTAFIMPQHGSAA